MITNLRMELFEAPAPRPGYLTTGVCRSLVVHVCLPGQAEAAPDLEAEFPELGSLGMSLVTVLDQLRLPRVVVLGEGAGANIAARFAMNHPSRVAGLVLVNLKTAVASLPFKLKALGRAARTAAEDSGLNPGNVAKFEAAYKRRDDILGLAAGKLAADTLVICGAESSRGGCARAAEDLRAGLEAGQCSVLILEEVASVLAEAADKLADSLILFCQGLGLVPSVQRKVSRSASVAAEAGDQTSALPKPRKISMEMFDIPNIRRLSLTSHNI